MNLQIRPACQEDLPILIDFNCRLAWETEGKTLPAATIEAGVRAMLADPAKGRYFVAEWKDEVVGQLGITLEWSDWRNGNFWWIQSVYIRTDVRRKGVFRSLFEFVRTAAERESEVIGIRLYVEEENLSAQATYRSLGMSKTHYQLMEICPLRMT